MLLFLLLFFLFKPEIHLRHGKFWPSSDFSSYSLSGLFSGVAISYYSD